MLSHDVLRVVCELLPVTVSDNATSVAKERQFLGPIAVGDYLVTVALEYAYFSRVNVICFLGIEADKSVVDFNYRFNEGVDLSYLRVG